MSTLPRPLPFERGTLQQILREHRAPQELGLNPIVTSAIAPDFMNTRRFISVSSNRHARSLPSAAEIPARRARGRPPAASPADSPAGRSRGSCTAVARASPSAGACAPARWPRPPPSSRIASIVADPSRRVDAPRRASRASGSRRSSAPAASPATPGRRASTSTTPSTCWSRGSARSASNSGQFASVAPGTLTAGERSARS